MVRNEDEDMIDIVSKMSRGIQVLIQSMLMQCVGKGTWEVFAGDANDLVRWRGGQRARRQGVKLGADEYTVGEHSGEKLGAEHSGEKRPSSRIMHKLVKFPDSLGNLTWSSEDS